MSGIRNNQAVLGASYLAALCADDSDMLAAYRAAFSADELLAAIAGQVLILARRVAIGEGRTLQELGDVMVATARLMIRTGYQDSA